MLILSETVSIALLALVIDALVGDPPALWSKAPHPVTTIGRIIALADEKYNHDSAPGLQRRRNGRIFACVLIAATFAVGAGLNFLIALLPLSAIWIAAITAIFLAQKSLYAHVRDVAAALGHENLDQAQRAVGKIVGRDVAKLDRDGIARAAIESLAENFSDGVIAPLFWFLLLGLPGIIAYKAVNTADSMIGHRNSRHEDFGAATARIDDLLNWPAARLSAVLIAVSGAFYGRSPLQILRIVAKDAHRHRSPNAGWPEAAMAGALNVALCGPRSYGGRDLDAAFLHPAGRKTLGAPDIWRALSLFVAACLASALCVALLAWWNWPGA